MKKITVSTKLICIRLSAFFLALVLVVGGGVMVRNIAGKSELANEAIEIPFREGVFGGRYTSLNGDETFSAIIRSQHDLITFFSGNDIDWHHVTPIWERYGDDYFENNALLLYFFSETSTDIIISIDNVVADETTLTISLVSRVYGNALNCAMQFVPLVIEVSQNDIDNATNLGISIRYENLPAN